jgi:hypothetical protein
MTALVIIEAIVIVLLTILVAGLLRSHGEILRHLHTLGVGEHGEVVPARPVASGASSLGPSPLAALTGPGLRGGAVSIPLTESRGYALLAFLSSTCTSCQPFWREPAGPELDGIRTVVVTKDPAEESPSDLTALARPDVTALMSSKAWDSFRVPATPYFALIDTTHGQVIGEGSAANWSRVGEMVRRAISDAAHPLHRSTADRKADIDAELAAAGIEPGDPRLYQPPVP